MNSNPRCLAEASTCGKDFWRYPRGKIRGGAPKGGLMLNSDLSPAAPHGGGEAPTHKTRVVSTRRRVPTNWVSGWALQPSIQSVVANSFVPSDFLVDGQLVGWGLCTPFSCQNSLAHGFFLLMLCHVVFFLSYFVYKALRRWSYG